MRLLPWLILYLAIVLMPLGVVFIPPTPAGRGLWVEFAAALGFIGFQQIVVQFMLVARFRRVTRPHGIDTVVSYHRWLGTGAILLLTLHPLLLGWAGNLPRVLLEWVNLTGLGSLLSLVVLAASSYRRRLFRLDYEHWRLLHALLGVAALVLGVVHLHFVGVYVNGAGKFAFFLASASAGTAFLAYLRVAKPLLQSRRPYRVVDVRPESGATWLVTVEPEGHSGFLFEAGQFAWLKVSRTPFVMEEHPFSFCSSAEEAPRLEFAIKEEGDWTSRAGTIQPGARAYLDGPHGAMVLPEEVGGAYTLIAGGIGIAPLISILRTLADRGHAAPLRLIYGNRVRDRIIFHDELRRLEGILNLEVVHVLQEPPPDWEGLTGVLDLETLSRVVGAASDEGYFICGPNPMVDSVRKALLSLGAAEKRIVTERFELV